MLYDRARGALWVVHAQLKQMLATAKLMIEGAGGVRVALTILWVDAWCY